MNMLYITYLKILIYNYIVYCYNYFFNSYVKIHHCKLHQSIHYDSFYEICFSYMKYVKMIIYVESNDLKLSKLKNIIRNTKFELIDIAIIEVGIFDKLYEIDNYISDKLSCLCSKHINNNMKLNSGIRFRWISELKDIIDVNHKSSYIELMIDNSIIKIDYNNYNNII